MYKVRQIEKRAALLLAVVLALTVASTQMQADTGTCGGASITLPFTDVQGNTFFCSIASAYFSGLTNGTTATTYSPTQTVTREQMAAFITRTMDQSLKRGGNRAALNQWWTPTNIPFTATTQVGSNPLFVQSDGADLWVANHDSNTVSRVRASDGKLLGTWSGATEATAVLVARGRIFVTGNTAPGRLYSIDPTQSAGAVTLVTDDLGSSPRGIAYDGSRIWIAVFGGVSIVSFSDILPCAGVCVTTVSEGISFPVTTLYDGANIWLTDLDGDMLKKLNSVGSVVQSISMGGSPQFPIFDGTNIWVPNLDGDSVTVVRVKDALGNPLAQAFVLATLTGNGLNGPKSAAFDGQRILVTNFIGDNGPNFFGDRVSLWRATDLTPLGSVSTGANTTPNSACSDGINFWITLRDTGRLARL
jgi:hypothetical protein